MSHYEKLARSAWKSGKYKASLPEIEGAGAGSGDAQGLRSMIRAKMEWIVERESCGLGAPVSEEGSKMKLAQHVKFREEKFGGVLFETQSEKVFTLSPTGAAVVREIQEGAGDETAIVERLKARYKDSRGELEGEAREFIASLKKRGLLVD